jgi:hypothetical protein
MEGHVSNGTTFGLWRGYILDGGTMVARYAYPYPAFSARAVARLASLPNNLVGGYMAFVDDNDQVIGLAEFQLGQKNSATRAPQSVGGASTGNGLYVPCVAPSVCGYRGGNALPGNWSWTHDLFEGIKQTYPQVWCPMYVNSRCD